MARGDRACHGYDDDVARRGGFMDAAIPIADAVERIKGVFLEVPGTRLSLSQTVRLSGLDSRLCESVLQSLEVASFLKRGQDGRYSVRAHASSA